MRWSRTRKQRYGTPEVSRYPIASLAMQRFDSREFSQPCVESDSLAITVRLQRPRYPSLYTVVMTKPNAPLELGDEFS